LIRDGLAPCVHDISDGGLLVALAEMALASRIGLHLEPLTGEQPPHALAFGEDQGRYLVAIRSEGMPAVCERLDRAAIPCAVVARCGGAAIAIPGEPPVALDDLKALHENWLPNFMDGGTI
jgi:Phosphoribosylformylglycinamidine (FGAM) synthase, synthetase domain